jgi:hypothetical protein
LRPVSCKRQICRSAFAIARSAASLPAGPDIGKEEAKMEGARPPRGPKVRKNLAGLKFGAFGETWERTPMPFKVAGNEMGRGNGERLAVDPNNNCSH